MEKEKSILVSESMVMQTVGGLLYAFAPNHTPRKAEVIMTKLKENFNSGSNKQSYQNFNYVYMRECAVEEFLTKLLFKIPEFEELNLSQNEIDAGLTVDNLQEGIVFRSAYDVETEDSWKDDFVDLDAFIRQSKRGIIQLAKENE